MSKVLITSILGSLLFCLGASAQIPQLDFKLDPDFEIDQVAFGLDPMDRSLNTQPSDSSNVNEKLPDDKKSLDEVAPKSKSQLTPDLEPVENVSDSTNDLDVYDEQDDIPAPSSIFLSLWPYLLIAVATFAWVLYQLCLTRAPSFSRSEDKRRWGKAAKTQSETESEQSKTDLPRSGQFKVLQRFPNPESEMDLKAETKLGSGDLNVTNDEFSDRQEVEAENTAEESSKAGPPSGQFKLSQRFQKPKSETGADAIADTSESNLSKDDFSVQQARQEVNAANSAQDPGKPGQPSGQFKLSQRFQKPENETGTDAACEIQADASESSSAKGDFSDKQEGKEVNAANSAEEASKESQPSGQFKLSQRFQKPENETGTDALGEMQADASESSSAKDDFFDRQEWKEICPANTDRPTDDEFEVGFEDSISDSGIIDPQEAAEIVTMVDAQYVSVPGSRFKTEIVQSDVLPTDWG